MPKYDDKFVKQREKVLVQWKRSEMLPVILFIRLMIKGIKLIVSTQNGKNLRGNTRPCSLKSVSLSTAG